MFRKKDTTTPAYLFRCMDITCQYEEWMKLGTPPDCAKCGKRNVMRRVE